MTQCHKNLQRKENFQASYKYFKTALMELGIYQEDSCFTPCITTV